MGIRRYDLDAKGVGTFPVGAIAVTPTVETILDEEAEAIKTKERLPGKESTLGNTLTAEDMRKKLLYLHKMQVYENEPGLVDDGIKNHNEMAIGMGMGTVRSKYVLPLTRKRLVVETKFRPTLDGGMVDEVITMISTDEEAEWV